MEQCMPRAQQYDIDQDLPMQQENTRRLETELEEAKRHVQQGHEAVVELQSARTTLATLQVCKLNMHV